jgi:pyrroline-5-carboxylate reductase
VQKSRKPCSRNSVSSPTGSSFSASTATIAAHFAYLNTIAAWLQSQEIPPPAATRYVASLFAGLAEATRSGERFEQLAREHATPGGINEQFLNGLEQAGTFEHVSLGLQRVLD